MNTNENKKNLLTVNPHALQGLHSLIGYDFEKPHTIAHLDGRFTVNNALQAIGGADRDSMITRYLRRARLSDIYTIEHCGHQYYNIRRVMLRSDLDSAKHLDKVSDTFLNAFWQCLHDDPTARDNDSERARIAGRLAVSALTAEEVPA